ncbi:type IVB secretion system protein IcmH/DotU [Vibrio mediterranei]|uniref:type IVB secretion system protein IcmH/DotU n=1 Tax=Vibrio mediterranei TaxID=689 RepID=UPI001EFD6EB0|nr:type IVB secretion system protein IcmH/DotU [Vibrio mediterranei]MCG9626439.1 type IVB secretion system protein IcmH/DotU [Vibrio mediterranei]
MAGLFNEEPTVRLQRTASEQPQIRERREAPNVDTSGTERLIEGLTVYGSPLMNAATELLGILVTIRRQGAPRDINRFRQQLLGAIEAFRLRGLHLDYHPSVIEKSCFVLCAAFDEAVLYTTWGDRARWENHSLLSKVFSQRNGGEAFFVLLEKASQQPGKLVDFIELQYVLLSLGFKGRYRHGDDSQLYDITARAYGLIRHYRSETPMPVPQTPVLKEGKQPWLMISMAKTMAVTFLLLGCAYGFTEYWYYSRSQPLLTQFSAIDMSGVSFKKSNSDLVYLSTDDDLGRVSDTLDLQGEKKEEQVAALEWEIILAVFSRPSDALRLSSELNQAGYESFTRESEHGIELYLDAGEDLKTIRKLKNELNVRFGLNATIKRAQK